MDNTDYDLCGLGNALLDIVVQVEDQFLKSHGLKKGSMSLVEADQANQLVKSILTDFNHTPGGSAGNTMAGFAALGAKGAFIGAVADDRFGHSYRQGMTNAGVTMRGPVVETSKGATGQSIILVTPDAQRTMVTSLGVANQLAAQDIDVELIEDSACLYLEGYLFDSDDNKAAFAKAALAAKQTGNAIALSLSDGFCVDRHRDDFLIFIESAVDILFGNEQEYIQLWGDCDPEILKTTIPQSLACACITRSEDGSAIILNGETTHITARTSGEVIDTTGAGDQYAAGVLYGMSKRYPPEVFGEIGAAMAGAVITHNQPRLNAQQIADIKIEFGIG